MAHLIDKNAIVAEIKELIRANELYLSESNTDEIRFQKVGAYSVLNDLLHFLDTLEAKEMNLEKEIDEHWDEWAKEDGFHSVDFAKYFFDLGLKARKRE